MASMEDYGSVEGAMAAIKSQADDIDRFAIPGWHEIQVSGKKLADVGAIIYFCSGDKIAIHRETAELILNDGILNRLNVKIELATVEDKI